MRLCKPPFDPVRYAASQAAHAPIVAGTDAISAMTICVVSDTRLAAVLAAARPVEKAHDPRQNEHHEQNRHDDRLEVKSEWKPHCLSLFEVVDSGTGTLSG